MALAAIKTNTFAEVALEALISEGRSTITPPMAERIYHRPTDELAAYFEAQCNRYANGGCTTLRCVKRGRRLYEAAGLAGRLPLISPGQIAHCEEWDAAKLIRALADQVRAASPAEQSVLPRDDGKPSKEEA